MILFDEVTKSFPNTSRPAVDAVSLNIQRGEFVFLVGPSGSGKSTMLRLVLREDTATSGRVMVAGRDVGKLSSWKVPYLRRQMGVVFQDFRLLTNKTVFENVAFALQVLGKSNADTAREATRSLKMVGLDGKEDRMPHELSGGEQQRVAVARAVVNRPAILLADEPTGNLDPGSTMGVVRLLERIGQAGTTVVMATHNDEIVNTLCKRVVELDDGRVVRDEQGGQYFPDADSPAVPDSAHARAGSKRIEVSRPAAEPAPAEPEPTEPQPAEPQPAERARTGAKPAAAGVPGPPRPIEPAGKRTAWSRRKQTQQGTAKQAAAKQTPARKPEGPSA
ncbi:MAG: cell division ATP-binding protein FtsE [Micrococcales bacterium]|nr:MAG: cell division ATP-binding protein FtsE [Micrococcales bacterium]PIE28100.1 MAG: cell division ATP-binding protein FtsE [Micrococcales bacterium]